MLAAFRGTPYLFGPIHRWLQRTAAFISVRRRLWTFSLGGKKCTRYDTTVRIHFSNPSHHRNTTTNQQNATKPGIPPTTPTKTKSHQIQGRREPAQNPNPQKIYMATTIGNRAIALDGRHRVLIATRTRKTGPQAKGK